jgi:hypothetical protein
MRASLAASTGADAAARDDGALRNPGGSDALRSRGNGGLAGRSGGSAWL